MQTTDTGRAVTLLFLLGSLSAALSPAWGQTIGTIPDWWARQVVVAVPRARPAAPKIDGNVGYQEWYHAAGVQGFVDEDTGSLTEWPVRSYWCYDDDFVYVGVVVGRPTLTPTPRGTFTAGQHEDIWWQDDNVEVVVRPGRSENGIKHYYAFVGNVMSAWSNERGEVGSSEGDRGWEGKWVYKATRAGTNSWHAELAIPVDQFSQAEKPRPGAVWFMNLMNQQLTPTRKMIDLGMIRNINADGYSSPHLARIEFVGDAPISRLNSVGPLTRAGSQTEYTVGLRQVFTNQGQSEIVLEGRAELYRAGGRPEGALDLYGVWDRVLHIRETGKPLVEADQEVQAFRSEADLLRELTDRFRLVGERAGKLTVKPGGSGYYNLETPAEPGEYICAWSFTDTATRRVVCAQVVPFTVESGLQLTLRPHFLKHEKVRAEASLRNLKIEGQDRVEFSLRAGGRQLDRQTVPVQPAMETVHTYLSTTGFAPGQQGEVTARLLRANGTEVLTNSSKLQREPTPSWFSNQIGRSRVVPEPFEPIKMEGDRTAALWQRRIEFGDCGLPAAVTARGEQVLAAPIQWRTGDVNVRWQLASSAADPRDAVFLAQGDAPGLRFQALTTLHYDGTARVELEVSPTGAGARLPELVLQIPISPRWARLATHNSLYTDPQRMVDDGFAGSLDEWFKAYPDGAIPFTYACFVGAEDRGIQWFSESDRGWSNADEDKVIALRRTAEATVLEVALIDKPLTLNEPWRTTFGLTVTPTKDSSAGMRIFPASEAHPAKEAFNADLKLRKQYFDAYRRTGINDVRTYMCDDNEFGAPRTYNPANEGVLKDYIAMVHENGFITTPYSGWGVSSNIPGFRGFGQEMLAEPIRNIGWGAFLHNPASVFADWWLDGARYTMEQVGFDGIYMDATCLPRLLENELDGLGWTDAQGRRRGSYPLWAIRDFIERLYIYTHVEAPKPCLVRSHFNHEVFAIGSFCDQKVTGELHYHRGATILDVATPSEFRAYFMTHHNGVATLGLWPAFLKLGLTPNQWDSMLILHDMWRGVGGGTVRYYEYRAGYAPKTEPWVRVKHIRDAFVGTEFIPYWEDRPVVACRPAGPLSSAWVDKDKGRALIVVSNLEDRPWAGEITLGPNIPAAGGIVDAMFDKELPSAGQGKVALRMLPQSYRLLIVGDRVPLPRGTVVDETADFGS